MASLTPPKFLKHIFPWKRTGPYGAYYSRMRALFVDLKWSELPETRAPCCANPRYSNLIALLRARFDVGHDPSQSASVVRSMVMMTTTLIGSTESLQ